MRIFLAILVAALSAGAVSAQTSESADAKRAKPEGNTEEHQIVSLPTGAAGKYKPKLSLQAAIKLAENYVEKEKIDISTFYLHQARFTMYGGDTDRKPAWHLWWVNEDGGLGHYVEITVLIDTGYVSRIPSM